MDTRTHNLSQPIAAATRETIGIVFLAFLINTDSHDKIELPDKIIKGTLGVGIGGVIEGFIGKTNYLSLGDQLSFQNIITNFQNVDSLVMDQVDFKRNGLIGNTLLSRFDIYIDYLRDNLRLDISLSIFFL